MAGKSVGKHFVVWCNSLRDRPGVIGCVLGFRGLPGAPPKVPNWGLQRRSKAAVAGLSALG